MIDAHVHLEKGDYSVEWIEQFVAYAIKRKIDEIYFLEHTHIFKECRNLYNEMSVYNEYQKNWYQKKWEQARPLKDYIDYIEKLKQINFPIRLKFGLEVCYSPEHEIDIAQIKQMYPFDFLVGSIHFIDGWAFSHRKQQWDKNDYDMDELYERYYALMLSLINSLFSKDRIITYPNRDICCGTGIIFKTTAYSGEIQNNTEEALEHRFFERHFNQFTNSRIFCVIMFYVILFPLFFPLSGFVMPCGKI